MDRRGRCCVVIWRTDRAMMSSACETPARRVSPAGVSDMVRLVRWNSLLPELILEQPDLVADGRGRDAKLARRLREAEAPRRRLEDAEAGKSWQAAHPTP